MKKFQRLVASFVMFMSLLAINPVIAHAEWRNNGQNWWYSQGDSYLTGWQYIDGNWYYFYSDGWMAKDTTIGGYYLNSQGAWSTSIPTQSTSSNVSNTNDKSQTVYITATGNKYHRIPKCGNSKYVTSTTLDKAQQQGYTACSKCW